MSRINLCLSLLVPGMLLSFLGSAHSSMAMVFQYDQDTALSMDFFPQVKHAIHHSYFLMCLSLTSQTHVYTPLKMNLMHQGGRCNYPVFSNMCLAMQVCPLVPAGNSCFLHVLLWLAVFLFLPIHRESHIPGLWGHRMFLGEEKGEVCI